MRTHRTPSRRPLTYWETWTPAQIAVELLRLRDEALVAGRQHRYLDEAIFLETIDYMRRDIRGMER